MTTTDGRPAGETRTDRILADPAFHAAVARRARFGWSLAAVMCLVYFGFIVLVAFAPAALGAPFDGATLSLGIVLGLVVIVAAFLLTAVYVARANGTFDRETRAIVERSL